MHADNATELRRILTLRDLILLIIGTVIGSGIFLVPGKVLYAVHGRLGLSTAVWLAGGVLSLLGALTYGELSAASRTAGGLYINIRDGFGNLPAFLYGWALFLVICSGSVATLAVAFGDYLGQLLPLSSVASKSVAVIMIAVVGAVNLSGTRRSAHLQNWMTAIKVVVLLVMSILLLCLGNGFRAAAVDRLVSNPQPLWRGLVVALISVLWAYEGWQYCTFSAGEVQHAQTAFPRAFLIASLALIGIYTLANLGYVAALGTAGAGASNRIAADAVSRVLGPGTARLITLAILISMFSAANGLTLTGTRVYYAMADDGLFFRRLAEIHPRFGTPALAVLAGSVWAALLAITGTFQQLLTYVVFVGWVFYALGAASIFRYRSQEKYQDRRYSVPGYPWTPSLFILSATILVVSTVVAAPKQALAGCGILLLGVPAYALWRRRAAGSRTLPA